MASSNAMSLDSHEIEGLFFFTNPEALPNWQSSEPTYKRIFVVRIDNANPASYRAKVREIPVGSLRVQLDLDQTHLQLAANAPDLPGVNSGRNLNLKFKTSQPALLIFHMTDPNATFVEADANGDPTHGVVKGVGSPDLLFQPRWVTGSATDREAVSVILKGMPKGNGLVQQYGLGVRLKNDDVEEPWSDYIIDPKVENEGDGQGVSAIPHLQSPSAS